jgi:hypothetical protein
LQTLTPASVDLSAVNNTSDVNKPVSTATQSALNLKADLSGANFSGLTVFNRISEKLTSVTISSGICTINYSLGSVFYITGTVPAANFTVNITNLPDNEPFNQYSVVLVYQHAYYASTVSASSVNGTVIVASGAPKILGGTPPSTPLPASAIYMQSFTILQCFTVKYIMTNLSSFN